ncbi:MAG TPA: cytochrome P450 [Archangium sp.]|nr:cytochrome P450 [Archangium sp.]
MPTQYSIFDPAFVRDPYPIFARMRSDCPVSPVEPGGFWAVHRYDDVVQVLKDPQTFSSEAFKPTWGPAWLGYNPVAHSMLAMDPPRHTQLRALVSRAFGPRSVTRLEAQVQQRAEALADQLLGRGEVDFVDEFALTLPGYVMAEMMGLDPEMRHHFKRWTSVMTGGSPQPPAPEVVQSMHNSLAEMTHYLQEVIEARRRHPQDDLVTDLIRAELDGQLLSSSELLEFLALLLTGGFETTIQFLGQAVLRLGTHPEELERLRAEPGLIPGFVEEMLRFDSPVTNSPRQTTKEVEIAGVRIPANAVVMAAVGSANRDEARYPDADRFDMKREKTGLAFGHGHHYCIGAGLARLEMRHGIAALAKRCRAFELSSKPVEWKVALTLRGPTKLYLRAVA